jgi:CheY-like chemotaxis protein
MDKLIHILMADDDADDHKFFIDALSKIKIAGYVAKDVVSVYSVYNGVQAIDYLQKVGPFKKVYEELPDFIVLDLNMPFLDGFGVLKAMRENADLRTIPVYILTTGKDDQFKKQCLELGCAGFFSKPGKLEELNRVVEKMLNATPD